MHACVFVCLYATIVYHFIARLNLRRKEGKKENGTKKAEIETKYKYASTHT